MYHTIMSSLFCRQGELYIINNLFIYYIIVHEVQNTHIRRKIGLKT